MSGKNDEDPSIAFVWLLVLLAAIGWVVWGMLRTELLELVRWIRFVELTLFGLIDTQMAHCAKWIRVAAMEGGDISPEAFKWAQACFGADVLRKLPSQQALILYNITPTSIGVVSRLMSPYLRWAVLLASGGLMLYATLFTIHNKYKTKYTLETLIKFQSKYWPIIKPIADVIPSKLSSRIIGEAVPDKLPPFAEALSPEEWVAYHRIPVVNNIPDREATRRAFMLQLGPRWRGLDDLPEHIQALFAAFALKGVQKREESDEFLGRIAACWSLEKGFVLSPEIRAEIRKYNSDPAIGGKALEIANGYAYRTTAILGVLKWARFMGGVLAPAHFIWVRAEDRNLWYPLNNLGRRSFHTEGAGALAHFMAENAARKPLPIPRLDTAIVTLNQYFGKFDVKVPSREEPNMPVKTKAKS